MASLQRWADRIGRIGYVAKGLVFVLVGALGLAAAAGLGGKATDPAGALAAVPRVPAGRGALALVALGLIAHAAARVGLSVTGEPYRGGAWMRRAVRRISQGFTAIVYVGLAATAAALSLGWRAAAHANKNAETRHASARLLRTPFGRPLLAAIAVGIAIAAIVQLIHAVGPDRMRERLRTDAMTPSQRKTANALGRIARAARAVVLAAFSYSVARAALDRAPHEAHGPGGALHAIGRLPHGDAWLTAVAAGLLAFGAYGLIEARWHRLFGRDG